MRLLRAVVLLVVCAAALEGQTPDAAQVLAAARDALGGEKALSAVKTFVATGRTRQVRGNNLVPIEFEINCALPDRFVRKDEFPAQDTDLTVTGFRGDQLVQFSGAPAGRGRGGPGGPGPSPEQRLNAVKQDFARLTLGLFASSFPSYPLTFKYAAVAESPEGQADVIDVTGPANFSLRLVVQRETHLPVMLMWDTPASARPPGQPQSDAAAPQPKPVDHRMYFADYRTVGGVKWPFRIRHAVAGATIEETTFDRFNINAKIDPRKFETPK